MPGVTPASFTCPLCAMKSYNPNDIREGYCGNCNDFTGEQAGGDRFVFNGGVDPRTQSDPDSRQEE